MAEELPEGAANFDPSADDGIGAPPEKRRSLTWMILLPLLLVAIGMLASDVFRGRIPQNKAFERVNSKLVSEQSDDENQSPGLTAQAVHDLLGRQPDLVENRSGNLNGKNAPDAQDVQMDPVVVETYKFPGIIKSYAVIVTYSETPAKGDKPATTALKYVRKE